MRLYWALLSIVTGALISQRDTTSESQYEAFYEPTVFMDAEKACKDKGMVLATVRNEEESRELTNVLQDFTRNKSLTNTDDSYHYWIGLRRVTSKPRIWFWEAGRTDCKLTKDNQFWGVEPPTGISGGDKQIKCVRVFINYGALFTHKSNWAADRCDDHQGSTGFVCQKPKRGKLNGILFAKKKLCSGLCYRTEAEIAAAKEKANAKKEPDAGATLMINTILWIFFIAT